MKCIHNKLINTISLRVCRFIVIRPTLYRDSRQTMQSCYRLKLNRIILSNTREHAFFYVWVRTTIVKNYITAKYYGKILNIVDF